MYIVSGNANYYAHIVALQLCHMHASIVAMAVQMHYTALRTLKCLAMHKCYIEHVHARVHALQVSLCTHSMCVCTHARMHVQQPATVTPPLRNCSTGSGRSWRARSTALESFCNAWTGKNATCHCMCNCSLKHIMHMHACVCTTCKCHMATTH